jgi:hypothetical protein
MAQKIKIRRGLKSQLKNLDIGELAYCTDTREFFIGTFDGNVRLNNSGGGVIVSLSEPTNKTGLWIDTSS